MNSSISQSQCKSMEFLNKEQKLIAKFKSLVGSSGRFIGDDCALLPGKMLVTTDTLVELIHFDIDWTDFIDLGWKAMAVNLSDIAAMAGRPKYALIVLSAPENLYESEKIISLYEGLNSCAQQYKTAIVGGDITRGTQLAITITIIGETHEAGVLMRSTAQAGDIVAVTGDFGASAAGLRILQNNPKAAKRGDLIVSFPASTDLQYGYCLQQFLRPQPKLEESWSLVEQIGSRGALMDSSDGLADALLQIAQSSHVGMHIDLNSIPIHDQTRHFAESININPIELALYGGEDYQLVACLPKDKWLAWQQESPIVANAFKAIGTVNESPDVQLMFGNEIAYKLDPQRIFQHIS